VLSAQKKARAHRDPGALPDDLAAELQGDDAVSNRPRGVGVKFAGNNFAITNLGFGYLVINAHTITSHLGTIMDFIYKS
jgi:hypothetical protein